MTEEKPLSEKVYKEVKENLGVWDWQKVVRLTLQERDKQFAEAEDNHAQEKKGCGKLYREMSGLWLTCGDKWGNLCPECQEKEVGK